MGEIGLPASLDGIKPTLIYPLLGILIISILMCFIFNPLIGLINTGLSSDRPQSPMQRRHHCICPDREYYGH